MPLIYFAQVVINTFTPLQNSRAFQYSWAAGCCSQPTFCAATDTTDSFESGTTEPPCRRALAVCLPYHVEWQKIVRRKALGGPTGSVARAHYKPIFRYHRQQAEKLRVLESGFRLLGKATGC